MMTQTAEQELDTRIAERVMGWVSVQPAYSDPYGAWFVPSGLPDSAARRTEVPHYSTDIVAAWTVVEKLNGMNATVEVTSVGEHADANPDPHVVVEVWGLNAIGMETHLASVRDVTAPLAICRAALAAMEKGSRSARETYAPEYDTLTTALRIAYGEDTTTTPTRAHLTALADEVGKARDVQRREYRMLTWLIDEGYLTELRRYGDGQWGFETDEGEVIGATARKAIKRAMEAVA